MNVSNIQDICILIGNILGIVTFNAFVICAISFVLKYKKNEEKNSKLYSEYLESSISLNEHAKSKIDGESNPLG